MNHKIKPDGTYCEQGSFENKGCKFLISSNGGYSKCCTLFKKQLKKESVTEMWSGRDTDVVHRCDECKEKYK